jgi:ectoine hydroxylase-related dioxygenase (phytanoyl-CoA dioxygenase family)
METTFQRPFPALTSAQRYFLDVWGYVVIQNTLTPTEISETKAALQKLKRELLAQPDPNTARVRGAYLHINKPHHHFLANIIEADPTIVRYATHPRLVGMAEELMASEARITEVNAHINSRDPAEDLSKPPQYGFHRGTDIPFGSHTVNGLYHCNFVKTLTNLTDLGPDDGGTVVIAGSHKVDAPEKDVIAAASQDRSLIHQVTAPAGSTLLFSETLIHATGRITSNNERVIIICGYGPTLFPYWDNGTLSEEFVKTIPEALKPLFFGKAHWTRGARYRKLGDAVDNTQ